MIDDKCPTCPKLGGPCDCGRGENESWSWFIGSVLIALLVFCAGVFLGSCFKIV